MKNEDINSIQLTYKGGLQLTIKWLCIHLSVDTFCDTHMRSYIDRDYLVSTYVAYLYNDKISYRWHSF